jgi:hypothetical protein
MAQTITSSSGDGIMRVATGRYLDTGTVAAYDFTTLGFTPKYVRVSNVTSRDMLEWFEGMADASAVKTVAAGTRTLITTLGITPITNKGFTLGLDTDVNVTSEQVSWLAIG